MERLTTRNSIGVAVYNHPYECDRCGESLYRLPDCGSGSPTDKLAELEDLEEQGRLLRLPVKKGDIVWELCECDDGVFRIFPMEVKVVARFGELLRTSCRYYVWNIYAESDYTEMYKSFYDIGTSVFLTREEAESKLKEMEESHD